VKTAYEKLDELGASLEVAGFRVPYPNGLSQPETKRVCRACKTSKATDQFYTGHRICKVCHRKRGKEWESKNPERTVYLHWRKQLKAKFGMTVEDFYARLAAQGGGCAICGRMHEERVGGRLHVDHCHESGRVRGLLCVNCNTMIGHSKDQPLILRQAAEYVENR